MSNLLESTPFNLEVSPNQILVFQVTWLVFQKIPPLETELQALEMGAFRGHLRRSTGAKVCYQGVQFAVVFHLAYCDRNWICSAVVRIAY